LVLTRMLYGSPVDGIEPTVVVDGTIASASSLLNLNPEDIAVIDVLEGDYARLYDDVGAVVSLVTKRPEDIKRPNPGVKPLTHHGFYRSKTFFSPDYATFDQQ
jgi:outer membrane receptor protein involved in Fe transport